MASGGIYATVAEMRLYGAPASGSNAVTDARLEAALYEASRTIDRITGFFFEKRETQTYRLDGDGTPVLELPAPCLTLTSVAEDGQAVDTASLINRNRPPDQSDDFWYPRIEWRGDFSNRMERAFGGSRRAIWRAGEENIVVVGDFGFVVEGPGASGTTLGPPPEIWRVTMMIAQMLTLDIAATDAQKTRAGRFLQSESIGNYSYSFGSGAAGAGNASMTGDIDIDAILARYSRSQMSTPGWR